MALVGNMGGCVHDPLEEKLAPKKVRTKSYKHSLFTYTTDLKHFFAVLLQ